MMTLKKRGKHRYGDYQTDIRPEIVRYSRNNEYVAQHFKDAVCQCEGRVFVFFSTISSERRLGLATIAATRIPSGTARRIWKRPS